MPDNIPTTADATLDRAYEEAMEMLIDARDFAKEQREASSQLESDQRLRLSQYTMQVTARLTQIMAWLMANKAVATGELPPETLADDTYATIGLTGPASTSGLEGAADPSIVEDAAQPITPYFLTPGATNLESTTLTGSSWYVLNTAGNGLPDENLQVLILQVIHVTGNL